MACAFAFPCNWFGFSFTVVRLFAFPSAEAALPPTPMDEVVPLSVLHVPAVPTVLAEVPPAAALPPDPTVAAVLHS
ncbi:putative transmembrane protein (plasmid) [Sinorhizobium sp. CCBAU 05631]|nr:putative transmembrane protein [Sinorhizobium sp. CCBAU 05631]